MLTEPQKQWVDALRSGKFAQVRGRLSYKGRYCCLGVACEIAIQAGVAVEKVILDTFGETLYDKKASTPPSVQNWLGLRTHVGEFLGGQLTKLNDQGATFDEIADIIESEPEGLFV